MKTLKFKPITRKHFEKLVKVIMKEFPVTDIKSNTATEYRVWNMDFIVRASVKFFIDADGETSIMVGLPGDTHYKHIDTVNNFKPIKKQLIAACRKYR